MSRHIKTVRADGQEYLGAAVTCDQARCWKQETLHEIQPRFIPLPGVLRTEEQDTQFWQLLGECNAAKLPGKWKEVTTADGTRYTLCSWYCLRLFVTQQERACRRAQSAVHV